MHPRYEKLGFIYVSTYPDTDPRRLRTSLTSLSSESQREARVYRESNLDLLIHNQARFMYLYATVAGVYYMSPIVYNCDVQEDRQIVKGHSSRQDSKFWLLARHSRHLATFTCRANNPDTDFNFRACRALVRIPLVTYIFILNFSIPFRSQQLGGAYVNEIKHDHSPAVYVVLYLWFD